MSKRGPRATPAEIYLAYIHMLTHVVLCSHYEKFTFYTQNMSKIPKPSASTQDHLDIDDIRDDLVILKTGWVALVMSTTAVNFDLLSEAEQDATIYAYGAFLNSLSFPIQTLIRSKKADITAYFQSLGEAEAAQQNPDLKRQIQKYQDFIQATVQQKTVLDKKFYLIINYSPAEAGFKSFGKTGGISAKSKGQLLEAAKASLAPKRDHVIKQTARLGLATRQLTTQELIELFYDIYNPAPTGTQRILLDTEAYTTPIVEPAIENPSPAKVQMPPAGTAPVAPVSPQGANLGNLRPVPQMQPPLQSVAPLPVDPLPTGIQVPLTPVPPNPVPASDFRAVPQPVPGQQANLGGGQLSALKDLQDAAAKAAALLNSVPGANPTIQPIANNTPAPQAWGQDLGTGGGEK